MVQKEAGGCHVCNGEEQVAQRNPQELIVLADSLESLQRVTALLRVGTQVAVLLCGTESHSQCGHNTQDADDSAEGSPTSLRVGLCTSHTAEEAQDGDHGGGHAVVANRTGEGSQRGEDTALTRGRRKRRNHAPVGDVTQGVENIQKDEDDDEDDDKQGLVGVHQTKETGENRKKENRRSDTTDNLPGVETTPAGFRVINEVTQQRVNKNLCNTNNKDKKRNNADHRGRFIFFVA